MSIEGSGDGFRPDRPEDIDSSIRPLASALAHVAKGIPVLPTNGKKAVRKGMCCGTRDPVQVEAWWARHPSADVGIVLDETGLVVLDVDGPAGVATLGAWLTGRDLTLPTTYTVTTSRGCHYYFRIPALGQRGLASQYGSQHGRPGLDIKMTWLLKAAGATGSTGFNYRGSMDHVPEPCELPYLPDLLWADIEARGRPASGSPAAGNRRPSRVVSATPTDLALRAGRAVTVPGRAGRRLEALLEDTSDGRDGRVFSAVLTLVHAGASDADIEAILSDSPLGEKVQNQPNPKVWLAHKIDSARKFAEVERRDFDTRQWWTSMLLSGQGDTHVRVLHALLTRADPAGIVGYSSAKVALRSAMTAGSASTALHDLTERGWLRVLREYDPKTRSHRIYSLEFGDRAQSLGAVSTAPTTPTPDEFCPQNMSAYTHHDAFRPRPGHGGGPTLHGGYRVLCLLSRSIPRSLEELSTKLGAPSSTVRRWVRPLREAGLVSSSRSGYQLTADPIAPLLDAAASRSNTLGTCAGQWRQYYEDCEADRAHREAMGTVGTPEWRQVQLKDHLHLLTLPYMAETRRLWEASGVHVDELGLMLVDQYERLLHQGPEMFEGFVDLAV